MSTSFSGKRTWGWRPDKPDQRDFKYTEHHLMLLDVPAVVDLRSGCPAIYDQGQLGSCTANAIGAAVQFDDIKQKHPDALQNPSRLFIYYNERSMEGTVASDAGAEIRDGVKSVASQGVCSAAMWPYTISKFAIKPPQVCYAAALNRKVVSYFRVNQTLAELKSCLASGFPIVFGISVYESFESEAVAKTGIVPMPQANESLLGGHAILLVGYDTTKQLFTFRNSWGLWGLGGYAYLPFAYVTNPSLADDFWTLRSTT